MRLPCVWMTSYHKDNPWCRYADDGIVRCKTEAEAQALLVELKQRFAECKLELQPDKTQIVYCKDGSEYDKQYPITKFKFLGYEFRRRLVKAKAGNMFVGFTPAICNDAKKDIVAKIRKLGVRNRIELSIDEISRWINPLLRGWINYYGKFTKSALYPVLQKFDRILVDLAMSKYKNLQRKKVKVCLLIKSIAKERRNLFAHWQWSNILGFV